MELPMRKSHSFLAALVLLSVSIAERAPAQTAFGPPTPSATGHQAFDALTDARLATQHHEISVLDMKEDSLLACLDSVKAGQWSTDGTSHCRAEKAARLRSEIATLYFLRDSLRAKHIQLEIDTAGSGAALSNITGLEARPIRYATLNADRRVSQLASAAAAPLGHALADFLVLGGSSYLGFRAGLFDHDAGGYADSFRVAPDKELHAVSSLVVGRFTSDLVGAKVGTLACLAAGAAFEYGQSRHDGYASRYDVAYDAGGCLIGAAWSAIARKLR
jgi:hypothetical protein